MFLFGLKKLAGKAVMPWSLISFLLVAGLVFLFVRRSRLGRGLVLAGTLLLLVFSLPLTSDMLARSLEDRYQVLNPAGLPPDLEAIVILSGGYLDRPELPLAAQLGEDTLQRTLEGIRLWRARPSARLIMCGGPWDPADGDQPPGLVMADLAQELGVDRARLVAETRSRDTYENALEAVKLLKGGTFAVVTSARHMPRTMAVFRKLNLTPLPAPTGHAVRAKLGGDRWWPSVSALAQNQASLHEYLGLIWYWIRDRI